MHGKPLSLPPALLSISLSLSLALSLSRARAPYRQSLAGTQLLPQQKRGMGWGGGLMESLPWDQSGCRRELFGAERQ